MYAELDVMNKKYFVSSNKQVSNVAYFDNGN